jgi:hypothetical protein
MQASDCDVIIVNTGEEKVVDDAVGGGVVTAMK